MITPTRHVYVIHALVLAFAIVFMAGAAARAASQQATVTVEFTVASHVALTDNCTDNTAGYQFGTVQPGSSVLTDTGANVCSFDFTSTNDTAMLRIFQADGIDDALGSHGSMAYDQAQGRGDAIAMSSATTGWTADTWGEVRYTNDGGATWGWQYGAADGLRGAAAFSATTAVVTGYNGVIDRTNNTGGTWASVTPAGLTGSVYDITAGSATVGWLVTTTGQIWKTTTAGATWGPAPQANPHVGSRLLSVHAVDANTAVVGGDGGRMAYTTDGGTNWNDATTGTVSNIEAIQMQNATTWYAADSSSLGVTVNSGAAYGARYIDMQNFTRIRSLHLTAANTLLIGGERGVLIRSTDGGWNWTEVSQHDTGSIPAIAQFGANDLLTISGNGELTLRSTDGGATWSVAGGSPSYAGIAASDASRMVRVGGLGSIERSTNGGEQWTATTSPTTNRLYDVDSDGNDVYLAVGDGGTILRSTDAGNTWIGVTSGTPEDLRGVVFGTNTDVWAVGKNGTVRYSGDAGQSWGGQAIATANKIFDIDAVDANNAMLSDSDGDIYQTTNGSAWSRVYDGDWWAQTFSIAMYDAQTAMTGNGWGNIRYTIDGGTSWPTKGGVEYSDLMMFGPDGDLHVFGQYNYHYAASFSDPFSMDQDDSYGKMDGVIVGQQAYVVGDGTYTAYSNETDDVEDYTGGTFDWATGADMFGACLQRLTGANTVADWTVDAAGVANQCQTNDADPWNAIPTTPGKIAHTTATGATGTADIVFGVKVDPAQAQAEMYANLIVEAVAPDV